MNKEEAEEYIKKLETFESSINDDSDELDLNFLGELNDLLEKLNTEMVNPKSQKKDFTNEDFDFSFNVNVNVKKLTPEAVIPTYSKPGDAGMDLTITNIKENTSFSITYSFGIAMEIPKGYVGLIFPRSSIRNQDLILSNCVGVIDSGYRGEIQATFKKTQGLDSISYNVGDRGAQILILPYPQIKMNEVDNLSDTERGTGGFGSTGN
jgi:dUTP pyrophosphatase